MTEPDGLPPVCDPCGWGFHEHCDYATGCECPAGICLPLLDEET